jgi:subtilase family serine protease
MKLMVPLVAALSIAACNGGSSTMPGTAGQSTTQTQNAGRLNQLQSEHVREVCPDEGPGTARCLSLVRTDIAPQINPATGSEPGLHPADFQSAYNLPSTKGTGQIVAIVDAYDNPNVASDLKTYRKEFGLPTANFTKYNQKGQKKKYPSPDANWGLEEDLDVDMVSASCPKCTIYLLEANSNFTNDLGAAEVEAVKLGAHIITNSWGGTCSGTCGYGSDFDTPGVVYLASAGDSGYGTAFPSQLGSVVSIGGTSLAADKGVKRGWTESVWGHSGGGEGTGGGCSTATKPSWQHDPGCTFRTDNDVAAAANPDEGGASEYDSYGYGGWIVVGGTSEAAPLNAGIYGLAGNAATQTAGKKFWTLTPRKRRKDLWVISSGADGTCSPTYLCTAGTHEYKTYSGPTGWGTPKGIGAY